MKLSTNESAAMQELDQRECWIYVHLPGLVSESHSRFSHDAGHYTQVVWADTDEIGCGFSYYSEQVGPFLAYKALTVCNYAIGGNDAGKPMYKIGAACSECESGYSCDEDLCAKN